MVNILNILNKKRDQLSIRYNPKYESIYCYYNPQNRTCFTPALLKEILEFHQDIRDYIKRGPKENNIKFIVYKSQSKNVFSLGGDLEFFIKNLEEKNTEALREYGELVTKNIYEAFNGLGLPIVTISAIDGEALGGGFECALATNIIIATKKSKAGVVDSKLNLFPGGGAFTFLKRSVGEKIANRIILEGMVLNAEKLEEMGAIDYCTGEEDLNTYLNKFLKKHHRNFNSILGTEKTLQMENPLDYQNLIKIMNFWVDRMSELTESDIKKIKRIVAAQYKNQKNEKEKVRTNEDRRCFAIGVKEDRRKNNRRAA